MFRRRGGDVRRPRRGRGESALTVSLFMKPQMAAATSHANRITKKKKNCGKGNGGDSFMLHPLLFPTAVFMKNVFKYNVLEIGSL